jgi:predicted 3-demethylubiquinone-9 3-methyltransferase (glyoxalase superfamily)
MPSKARITPCLWFDSQAEEAANYYVGIFKNSKVRNIGRYGEAGKEQHQRPPGSVMIVEFDLDGQSFTALNGGPIFRFNEAVSLQVSCKDQAEVDYHWDKLSAGGDPKAQVCGWLKDKYGLSWQVVPDGMAEVLNGPDQESATRAMQAMFSMKKLDLAALQAAADNA